MLYLGLYDREARVPIACVCVKARKTEKTNRKDVCGLFFPPSFSSLFSKRQKITKGKGKNNIAGACTSKDGKNQREGAGRMPVWSLASCHTHDTGALCKGGRTRKRKTRKRSREHDGAAGTTGFSLLKTKKMVVD